MKIWYLLCLSLFAFAIKALIYQMQGRILDELVCLGWFVVVNSLLGAALGGITNYQKQMREREREERYRRWRDEDLAAEKEEEEDNES